jgi:hypothetical protein
MSEQFLTYKEAFSAMIKFLDELQKRTNSDDLAEFLGSMEINRSDGMPMDIAFWNDWIEAIGKVRGTQSSPN